MSVKLNPYLAFRDNAREALEFYRSVFGGELTVMTFGEGGMPHEPDEAGLLMHGQLEAPGGLLLMAADTPSGMDFSPGSAISVAVFGDEEPRLAGYWAQLSDGGTVQMPLEKAPWGDTFGMCLDKFGVAWMINISGRTSA